MICQVNIRVGQGLASAIDTGEKVTHATKERLGEFLTFLSALVHL
jgi:hypothetical protein